MSSEDSEQTLTIPEVPKQYYGLLGNLPDVDPSFLVKSIWQLQELHGDIFQLEFPGQKIVVVSNYELIHDVSSDDTYEKVITAGLKELRPFLSDGLFSAHPWEKNWWKAHRILMPVFGPLGVRKMFDQQLDIASQMILKWDRQGPDHAITCSDDFTRLAFDTIGFCAFNHRFNNFYSDNMDPFAVQMADHLIEAGKRAIRPKLETSMRVFAEKKFFDDMHKMHKLCDDIVAERIEHPQPEVNDLLNVMLSVEDPETGEKLDKDNIRYNMATFLVAGHETTSGTLSFLFYNLMKNPEAYHKAQQEVDEVVGDNTLTVGHLPKLKYVDAAIKETLRYLGPIQANTRHAKEARKIAGKYPVDPSTAILMNLRGLHHDPKIWGEDHDEFKPERMLDMSKYPPGAWQPFGAGMRACIGRTFAEQEMLINAALILQRFQVSMANPAYNMKLKSTLTIKPWEFEIKVRRRPGKGILVGLPGASHPSAKQQKEHEQAQAHIDNTQGPQLTVLYGSNAGTCKGYAEDLVTAAEQHGYSAQMRTLDSAVENEPRQKVAIIAPSYEGKPADNSKKFVSWLEANTKDSHKLSDFKYGLCGVGNSEWVATFHKVPKLIDDCLTKMGAKHLHETGFVDVKYDAVGPWEEWRDSFIATLSDKAAEPAAAAVSNLEVKLEAPKIPTDTGEAQPEFGTVIHNMQLADNSCGAAKMHMEIELPDDLSYSSGDYLVVWPNNHRDDCKRVLAQFRVPGEQILKIGNTRKAFLATNEPISLYDFLESRVEIGTPITQKQLLKLAENTEDSASKKKLQDMATDEVFKEQVFAKRYSILDVLEDVSGCKLSFAEYLDMLKPLSPRQYSISSSPLAHRDHSTNMTATITYDVHEAPSFSNKSRVFHGVASTYLSGLRPGSQIRCTVRQTNGGFHLPADTETPVIMICAGSGIAPMHGFIQERSIIADANSKPLGPALLYFGCRDYTSDYLFKEEFEQMEKQGVVNVRPAFSRKAPDGKNSFKYTSDRLWAERNEVAEAFRKGAKILICGSASKIAKSTADTCKKIYMEKNPGKTEQDAADWLEEIREVRYVSDVFD